MKKKQKGDEPTMTKDEAERKLDDVFSPSPAEEKGRAADTRQPQKVSVEVMLKGVGIGKDKAGIGWEAKREDLALAVADEVFTEAHLEVMLEVAEDQREMFDGPPARLSTVADNKTVRVGISTVAGRLVFRRGEVDQDALLQFAGKIATLHAKRLGFFRAAEPKAVDA